MNLEEAEKHLSQDQFLTKVIASVTLQQAGRPGNVYFNLLESIVSQQLSVKVADVIFGRFIELFPDKYPHPALVLQATTEQLRSVGLSNQKAGYLQNVASFSLEHDLENRNWADMSDEAIIAFLTQIKGVGKWTVEMILMFTLRRPDILPIDDLGIQQGMAKIFSLTETGKELKSKMISLAEPWRPYRTVACWYIWRWKDANK